MRLYAIHVRTHATQLGFLLNEYMGLYATHVRNAADLQGSSQFGI